MRYLTIVLSTILVAPFFVQGQEPRLRHLSKVKQAFKNYRCDNVKAEEDTTSDEMIAKQCQGWSYLTGMGCKMGVIAEFPYTIIDRIGLDKCQDEIKEGTMMLVCC